MNSTILEKNREKLISDLRDLTSRVQSMGIAEILNDYPEIGQQLSNLCKNPSLLNHEANEIFDLVFKCILSVAKLPNEMNCGGTGMERRVQSWGTTVLHNLTSNGYYNHEKVLMDEFNIQPKEYNKIILEKIETHLEEKMKEAQCQSAGTPLDTVDAKDFVDLLAREESYYEDLLPNAKIFSWLKSLTLFEKEVLSIFEVITENRPFMSCKQVDAFLLEKQLFIQACAQHSKLRWHTFELFRFAIHTCVVPPSSLVLFLSSFSAKLRKLQTTTSDNFPQNTFHDSVSMFTPSSSILWEFPYSYGLKSIEYCIKTIAADVMAMRFMERNMRDVFRFHLHQAYHWIEVAFYLLLHGSEEILTDSLQLICFYYLNTGEDIANITGIAITIKSFVLSLRRMEQKIDVIASQVITVVENCCVKLTKTEEMRLLCVRILTLFLLHFRSKGEVLKDVFTHVTQEFSVEIRVDVLLRCLESTISIQDLMKSNVNPLSLGELSTVISETLQVIVSSSNMETKVADDFVKRSKSLGFTWKFTK